MLLLAIVDKLNSAVHKALNAGITINELKEILVHIYAYCGFTRSLNAISTLMTVWKTAISRGLGMKLADNPHQSHKAGIV